MIILIALGIALAASASAFAILYPLHLWLSRREDERIMRGDDEPLPNGGH